MKKKLIVNNMSCDHCKRRVETALMSIPGVKAEVTLKTKTCIVESPVPVTDKQMVDLITEAGYEVESIEEAPEKKGFFFRNKNTTK